VDVREPIRTAVKQGVLVTDPTSGALRPRHALLGEVAEAGLLPREYQRLIHQPPYIAEPDNIAHQSEAISYQIRHADRAEGSGNTGFETEQKTLSRSPLVLPFATSSHPSNEMSVVQKLTSIVVIAIGASFSAGMFLAGLESLSRMIGQ